MTRTKLRDRQLPDYCRGEENMNAITHMAGGGLAVVAAIACAVKAFLSRDPWAVVCSLIYGISMIAVYTMSSIYHALRPGTAKKVLQVLDHCAIYLLIAGTYTPVVLCALRPVYPMIGWGLFVFQWALAALAITLTAIDLKCYRVFSMVCYIGMGWSVILFLPQTLSALGGAGFGFLLAGGIAYSIGAVLFGLGKKLRWMHAIFHLFVIFGSVLQLITVLFYVL